MTAAAPAGTLGSKCCSGDVGGGREDRRWPGAPGPRAAASLAVRGLWRSRIVPSGNVGSRAEEAEVSPKRLCKVEAEKPCCEKWSCGKDSPSKDVRALAVPARFLSAQQWGELLSNPIWVFVGCTVLVLGLRTSFVPAASQDRICSARVCWMCSHSFQWAHAYQLRSSCTFDVALVPVYKIYLYHPKPFCRWCSYQSENTGLWSAKQKKGLARNLQYKDNFIANKLLKLFFFFLFQ